MANLRGVTAAAGSLCVAFAACPLPSAHASYAEEAAYLASLNGERRAHGLPALREVADLDSVAQRWSRQMADASRLAHNPRLTSQVSGWQVLGENVGEGPTVGDLDAAFMASPEHRANVLDRDYTQVGVGTVRRGGILWITVDFRRPDGARQARPSLRPAVTTMNPLLSLGSVGSAVARLQRLLGIEQDGIFGPDTQSAVVAYQRAHDLLVDGIVGPQTWGALTQ